MKKLKPKHLLLVVLSVLIMTVPAVLADDAEPRQSTTGPEPPVIVRERDVIRALGVPPVAPVVIGGVPDYTWRHGCGPTALGNVVGYYDGQGYGDLVPGDASTQTAAVDQAIASQGSAANPRHYEDYSLPIDSPPTLLLDKSEPPFGDEHPNDCIADFQMTSWSRRGNYYGWGYDTDVGPSFVDYINMINPAYSPTFVRYRWSALTWSILTTEIDNGRPMVFLVDTDGNGSTDHFVTIVGYDTATGQYGCHDTWAPAGVRWESFQGISAGNPWGIYSGISFKLAPLGLKWKQPPDETENGIDIRCDRSDGIQRVLADDFKCTKTSPITKIVFWGSWKNDIKGKISNIHLSIHEDLPDANEYSMPGTILWTRDVGPADFNEMVHYQGEPEWCWDPAMGQPPIQWCDAVIWKYVIPIDPSVAFVQQGDPCNPVVYWLDIHVMLEPDDRNPEFGWKTTPPEYQWNDDAVFSPTDGFYFTWYELIYPSQHPYAPGSVDLSFAIVTEEAEEPNEIKWSQPPIPIEPDNLFYGWNEISEYDGNQIVADDWQCDNDDPVTEIHWWGSFKGWNDSDPPPADQSPTSFHIAIWNDIPANPLDPNSFSHPNEVVWEVNCNHFTTKFVGWDYDPRTNCFEACFYYEQVLIQPEYFYQRTNPDGTPSIYWISIAAQYPAGTTTENQWGWKTRRRFFNDDAVKIRKPTNPHIGNQFEEGKPIYWPDETHSWDMAFELTSRQIEEYAKWSQPPKYNPLGGTCYYGWDELSLFARQQIVADDWVCSTQDPVKEIHWWGSYFGWNGENPPPDAPDRFHIGVWTDVPIGPVYFSHPGQMIWEWVVPRSALFESYNGCDTHPLLTIERESCFYYEFKIPESQWFYQEFDPAGNPTIYWLSISAIYENDLNYPWGWKTRLRDVDSQAPDDAVRIFNPTDPAPGMMYAFGQPIWWPDESVSWDTAFELTSTRFINEYTKWSQKPEPYTPKAYDGWNELSVYYWNQIAADDWFCDTDQPVADIHWWGSFLGWSCEGQPPQIPDSFHIAIWTDVPATPGTSDFSHPGVVIWETNCNNFTSKFVGWDIDPRDPNAPPEACFKFEQDLPEEEWFYQQPGGNIYWISIAARYPTGTSPMYPWGWKTRRRDLNSRAPDDAVRINNPTDPILGSMYMFGEPIWWPTVTESWDLAFELTTKEKEPKKPVPHLKWSQPPIEMDPSTSIPIYCGWDEPSYTYFPPDTPDRRFTKVVADDYRCIGSMPVTSLHWWGSYVGWDNPQPPLLQPDSWTISFWSNVPASGVVNYSYPQTKLWEISVPASRVKVDNVGQDEFPLNPDIFPETCFQYYVDFLEDEIFWQEDYLDETQDNTFWISIVAVYPSTVDIQYPWGWKTRPWSWMDDAVTVTINDPAPIIIPAVLDPAQITPIEYQGESYDVAFELDTDPNYIKWEQPFTGIRRWPLYHDEESIAREVTTTENLTKWAQKPDLTDTGVDVDATFDQFVPPSYDPQLLADDFNCVSADTIDDIHIYGSWWGDNLPGYDILVPGAVDFTLSIHEDLPVGDPRNPHTWSIPGDMIWSEDFAAGDFSVVEIPTTALESYYMPCRSVYYANDHSGVWKYSFSPRDPYLQEGSPDNPIIYWLDVQARPQTQNPEARFGWKTRDLENDGHFNDDATWVSAVEPYNGDEWRELIYPPGNPLGGQSMDLAFELTTEKVTTEFIIDRLVADDWKCEKQTPVTAAVWWGSYIGFRYQPCRGTMIVRPRKPDYFHLSIWTDVPAGVDPAAPFSHPNEVIWKYNAFEYDEVLVGYDKYPHDVADPPREPVFRYSVRLPQDAWFMQEDVNNIYWFSVVAVYKDSLPNVHWGWTNHPHVFSDDAVAGFFDVGVGDWVWDELYDQTNQSEDMSFMLFTEPECLNRSAVGYIDWLAWGSPDCWCYQKQCRGDINGQLFLGKPVTLADLNAFKLAFNQPDPNVMAIPDGICSDLNHKPFLGKRVTLADLNIFKTYFNVMDALVPKCDQLPIYTGPYNYWTKP